MNRAGSESFGSEHDPYGPAAYDSSPPTSPPKRQGSEIHSAVLYDVPLEFESLPLPESDDHLSRGTGVHRLRRVMRIARAVFLVAVAFLVAILLLFIPKGRHKENAVGVAGQNQLESPNVVENGQSCNNRFIECVGDRLSHSEILEPGDAICSTDRHFELGMDMNGTLVWQDCSSGEFKEYYHGQPGYSFEMDQNGDFIVRDDSGKLKKKWDFKEDMKSEPECFQASGLMYDCPFLHIHKMKGRVVLNWEDTEDEWHSKGINGLYDFE